MSAKKECVIINLPTEQIKSISIKPGVRASIGGVSYMALIPHSILAVDLHKPLYKNLVLVEYWKEGRKKDWVSLKDLEERGVIKLLKEAEV